ncbi:MAG: MalY/PatB family protein, partial [Coprobacillaceae bacterium]
NRVGTDSAKWDAWKEMNKPEGVLPLWVADMDFKAPQPVLDALIKRVEHGVFGYTTVSDDYRKAVMHWMKSRHDWEIQPEWIVPASGVVAALKIAVNAYTEEGDAIIIQKPVYYPFDASIEDNNRKVIENPMVFNGKGFSVDFEDFENKIIDNQVKVFILCNPYNPIGKVFTREELQKLGDICKKHNVLVISDEIHQDFVFGNRKHIPFYEVDPSFKEFSIICTAPSKTFNLAGLQDSNIIIANEKLREAFSTFANKAGFHSPNPLALLACKVAYNECADWCDAMLAYVEENYKYMDNFFKTRMPQIKLVEPEGLYLAWVDFSALGMNHEELEDFMLNKAKLWLDEGYIFGMQGAGFERFNVATPRATLKEALERLEKAMKEEKLL